MKFFDHPSFTVNNPEEAAILASAVITLCGVLGAGWYGLVKYCLRNHRSEIAEQNPFTNVITRRHSV